MSSVDLTALDTLNERKIVDQDETHVRLVDAHAERSER